MWVIQIGGVMSKLLIYLCEAGGAQAVLPLSQINQNQVGITRIGMQLRRQGLADIPNRCKCRHDQGQGCGNLALLAVLVPNGFHGH